MPYPTVESLPDHVKKYPPKTQRRWMAIWNSVYKQTGSEERAYKAANASLSKNNMEDTEIDKFIEDFLKEQNDKMAIEEFKLKAKDIKSIFVEETDDGILLHNVPVFKTGEYGGQKYDTKYIDDKLIKQFDPEEDIPFQADHSDSSRDTLGYVRKLTRNGDLAEADIELRDDNAIARWKKGLLKKFSLGIYTTTGKLREISTVAFPRVKEAVVHAEAVENKDEKKCAECDTKIEKEKTICNMCEEKHKKEGEERMAEEKKVEELLKEAAETQTRMEEEKKTLNTKLAEKDVELKKLQDTIKSARIDGIITELKAEGKILPAIEAKTKELLLSLDDVSVDKLVALFKEVKATVELGEKGAQNSGKDTQKKIWADDHSAEECMKEAEARSKKNSTTYQEEYNKLFVAE